MKIILMGNPNVGKSAIFSRLTGINVITANYPGSSVEYTEGKMKLRGETAKVIDAPGVYSLDPSSKVEKVAAEIFDQGADVVVNVVDATNLERNLNLTLQLLEKGLPMVVALNLWDMAAQKGITIDARALEAELGVSVIPTVAVSGQGIHELVEQISRARIAKKFFFESSEQRWGKIGEIAEKTQKVEHRHPTLLDRLEDLSLQPVTGILIAFMVLYLSFNLVIDVGELLQHKLSDPLFTAYSLFLTDIVNTYIKNDILKYILVGSSPELLNSYGILTTGIYLPFGIVLPFLIPFYLVLGFLEDLGYLPRLSVLMDSLMHRIGLHGAAILPCILGMGCSVPAVLSVRILDSAKQRYLAATLMTMAIPCASQNAMIFAMLAPSGLKYIALVYITLFLVFIIAGYILHKAIGGESPEVFQEIPPYRMPDPRNLLKKTFYRTREFLKEAVPYIALGMLIMNIFFLTGLMERIDQALRIIVSDLIGLPSDAATPLLIGFLRKDVGIGMFAPLEMTPEQLVIASVVLAMYFPCVATFMVMIKELGIFGTAKSVALRLALALLTGASLNIMLSISS